MVTERLIYYVGINNLLGMVGALGCARPGRGARTARFARDRLAPLRGHQPVDLLLGAATLRCKANLLTRAAGLDELVGDLATQSVYVEFPNPCADSHRSRRWRVARRRRVTEVSRLPPGGTSPTAAGRFTLCPVKSGPRPAC